MIRAMIAQVMHSDALETLRFVFARTEVSLERRAALAEALERGVGGTAADRRIVFCDFVLKFDGY